MTAAELDAICREVFPMRAANDMASLEYVETTSSGWLRIVTRLVVWNRDEATQTLSISDVKEQEVGVDVDDTTSPERVRVYMTALARVLAKVLANEAIVTAMPHELLITSPLRLQNATTVDDFEKALSAKSRLGRLLPPPALRVLTTAELDAIFRAVVPAEGVPLEYLGAEAAGGAMRVVMRLGDVQESVALFGVDTPIDVERLEAYVRALARVLRRILPKAGDRAPSELVDVSALQLASLRTEADFVKALSAKSRLGRFG